LYFVQGKTAAAIGKLEEVLKATPDNTPAYLSLAQIHMQGKEYRKAIQVYERLLARQPKVWAAANDLAFLLGETTTSAKELDTALDWARKAQAAMPQEMAIQDTLGWIYYKKGDFKKAEELIVPLQEKAKDNPSIAYHLGMIYFKTGKRDQAREQLSKAVAVKEDFSGKDEAVRTLKQL
jgi:tetratricopeptide (TPR) repeat protein